MKQKKKMSYRKRIQGALWAAIAYAVAGLIFEKDFPFYNPQSKTEAFWLYWAAIVVFLVVIKILDVLDSRAD